MTAGCCQACGGKGGTSESPCWDCRTTGCAHPAPLCPQPGENPVESEANRRPWVAEGDWVVVDVGRHTCGTGVGGHYGAHERGCGLEPLTQAVNAEHARHLVDDHNALLDRVTALEEAAQGVVGAWESSDAVVCNAAEDALRDLLPPAPDPGGTDPHRGTPDPPTGTPGTTTTNP